MAYLSLKSMVLVGHDVKLYTYSYLTNVPEGVEVIDANTILDKSKVFKYNNKYKTYSGFANWFRFKRLYEYGGTWLDLDILLIKNVNEVVGDEIAVCSEPGWYNYIQPNNAFMRFPKGDRLIKKMMECAENIGSNAKHAQTGPTLVDNLIHSEYYEYHAFLKHFNINNLLGWYETGKYSENAEGLLLDVNMDEIFGFHFVNTHFSRLNLEKFPSGLFSDLKTSIIVSNDKEEYTENLIKFNILKISDDKVILKNRDLQYGNITTHNDVDFTFLIDITKLKKVEAYSLLTSVEKNFNKSCEFLIFGKNNLSSDSMIFKDSLKIFNSKFEDINQDIFKYIGGKYIIPINEPLFFKPDVCKDFIKSDIQIVNFKGVAKESKFHIFNRDSFAYFNEIADVFDLDNFDFTNFNFRFENLYSDLIVSYKGELASDEMRLIEIIDGIDKNGIEDFQLLKDTISKIFRYNLIERLSFYYFSKCKNIVESESLREYELKEEIDYLKQFSNRYLDELRYIKCDDKFKKVIK